MKAETAQKIKDLLIRVSPLIEEHTRKVCPSCREVCCKQQYGMLTTKDRAYLQALGAAAPQDDAAPPEAICRSLGAGGCMKPRWLRAWKCTWFFCDPLIETIQEASQRKSRALTALIEEILNLRNEL